jgi:hypothetical protein
MYNKNSWSSAGPICPYTDHTVHLSPSDVGTLDPLSAPTLTQHIFSGEPVNLGHGLR